MIRTVARPIAPVFAETPIASPSAKLCSPIATAIVMPVCSARRRGSSSPAPRAGALLSVLRRPRCAPRRRLIGARERSAARSRRCRRSPTVKPTASSANSAEDVREARSGGA